MNSQRRRIRITLVALAAAAALVLTPTLLSAQPGYGHGPHHGRGAMFHRLLERLDLTAEQEESIHQALMGFRERTWQMHQDRRAAHRALGEAIHADLYDESAIRQAAADLAVIDAELAVVKGQMFQEISKVLTQEQRDRARQMMEDWHAMADEFRGRRFGKGPGYGPRD